MNYENPGPLQFKIPNFGDLFNIDRIFPSPEVGRRYKCVALAGHVAPKGSTVYDVAALADYLDRGHPAMDEPAPCSCNNPEDGASHPRGDSAFCSMAAE